MRVGSLFAGIGGFDLGFERAGFSVAWHAEIDKAASAILAHRWPGVPNLGDVTKIDGASIEPVDVICGGFPCQDLSVAGKRAGFTGKRSVLAFEFLRIVAEMREATNGRAPAFIVLENVPGLFSSAGGRDFGALLDALGELGPLDVAWRVLDSRYFGVAQRRRRVFVVVDFGGERCDEILALTEGLRGDSPARGAAREDVAGTLGGGSSERGWPDDLDRAGAFITGAVTSKWAKGSGGPAGDECQNLVAHSLRADGFDASEDGTGRGTPLVLMDQGGGVMSTLSDGTVGTLRREMHGNTPAVCIPFDTTQVTSKANRSVPQPGAPCHPLAAGAHPPAVAYGIRNDAARDGVAKANSPDAEGRLRKRDAGFNVYREQAPTLDATAPHSVAFNWQQGGATALGMGLPGVPQVRANQTLAVAFEPRFARNGRGAPDTICPPLKAQNGTSGKGDGAPAIVSSGVRRLTPRECERLQGFPDDWTAIPGMADGPRYKCLGNAVTVNVAEWIARRMV